MWIYKEKTFEESGDHVGFVYLITNLSNGRKYIGKKLFKFTKTKQVKGKKKRFKVDSDWKTYYGSSEELTEDVKKCGESFFKREILRLCSSKGECTYYEARYQFINDVLVSDGWYNSHIMCRVHKKHLTFLKK
jgi:hypothetical protein